MNEGDNEVCMLLSCERVIAAWSVSLLLFLRLCWCCVACLSFVFVHCLPSSSVQFRWLVLARWVGRRDALHFCWIAFVCLSFRWSYHPGNIWDRWARCVFYPFLHYWRQGDCILTPQCPPSSVCQSIFLHPLSLFQTLAWQLDDLCTLANLAKHFILHFPFRNWYLSSRMKMILEPIWSRSISLHAWQS